MLPKAMPAPTPKGGVGCGHWFFGCIVLAIVGVAAFGGLVIMQGNRVTTPTTTVPYPLRATPSPEVIPSAAPSQDMKRLFLEEHRMDDSARTFIFQRALRKSGERCDSVEKALMSSPGAWQVHCSPGHVYGFVFDQQGGLVSAVKIR